MPARVVASIGVRLLSDSGLHVYALSDDLSLPHDTLRRLQTIVDKAFGRDPRQIG